MGKACVDDRTGDRAPDHGYGRNVLGHVTRVLGMLSPVGGTRSSMSSILACAHASRTRQVSRPRRWDLRKILEDLVCLGDEEAIQIVRGPGWRDRVESTGDAAFGLIDRLTNKDGNDCPVAAVLTSLTRTELAC